ncbi:MAG: cytochrome b N-terminal domain-containing protein [Thermoguttaceae bacterium]
MALENLRRQITETQLWRSVFRHGAPSTARTRSLVVVSNFFLHLHPVTLPSRALRFTFTWGLGGISFLLFAILVITGILLTFYYVPDVNRAYQSMKDLQFAVPFGVFLRNMHRWSAHAMVLAVILHMARVFYTGSYRPPREFNWVLGVGLLALVLVLSFTGYLLPMDQLAYWAVTVGTNMASSSPLVGHTGPFHELTGARIDNDIRFALLGGTVVGQNALIRFYVLHCMAIPVIFSFLVAIHFWRIRKDGGISCRTTPEPCTVPAVLGSAPAQTAAEPVKSNGGRYRLLAYVRGDTFSGKRDLAADEVQVWPSLVVREVLAAMTVIIFLWTLAILCNAPLEEQANPAVTPNPAKAPWYFVGLQELLAYFDPWIAGVAIPTIILFGLASIAYLDVNREAVGEYNVAKRKFAVTIFTLGTMFWFALIFIGMYMRGPSWAWYWPWEDWTVAKQTVSTTWNLPLLGGSLLLVAYFALGLTLPAVFFRNFRRALGPVCYLVTMVLLLMMIGVPAKILLRLAFNVKYFLHTPWFNI